ncbi:MAG: MATE family efflux transporter [Cyclobacteriaceae bacterium]
MAKKRDLTEGSIPENLIGLTLPMMLGIISMVAFNLVDTYFVGKLGSDQLAALSFTFPVIMVIFSIIQGIGIGATALISKSIGRKDKEKAARETTDSLALAVVISGIFITIGLLTLEPTFRLLGASDQIMPYVVEYMKIWYFALFFVTIPYVGNSAIRATGDARTPSLIMIFAVIINAILDPLLIFGYGPFPELGLKGAAYATAISRCFTMILAIIILRYRENLIVLKVPTLKVLTGCWKAILYIGVPSGASKLITPIATGIITALLAIYGDFAVAAYGVGSRIEFLAMSILFALSASIGPFSGQNFGAKKLDRITRAVNLSNGFSLIYGFFAAIIIWFFAEPFAGIFTSDQQVIQLTKDFLMIVPISFGFQGIVQNVNSNINTLDKPLEASMVVFIQMILIGLPLLYLGDHFYGAQGIYAGLALTYFGGGVLSFFFNKYMMTKITSTFKA